MTNADALAQLERLIQTQTPADVPWKPVTDYSKQGRTIAEGKHPDLIVDTFAPLLRPRPLRVLDVGCGIPPHLLDMLRDRRVDGQGMDTRAVDRIGRVVYGDIAQPITSEDYEYALAPLVICREVLEHLTLRGVAQAVRNLCALSTRFVYVTTRFAKNPDHFLSVDTSDDLDPTHISLLNRDFLRLLFVLEGFRRRADLEQQMDWKGYGRVLVYER